MNEWEWLAHDAYEYGGAVITITSQGIDVTYKGKKRFGGGAYPSPEQARAAAVWLAVQRQLNDEPIP